MNENNPKWIFISSLMVFLLFITPLIYSPSSSQTPFWLIKRQPLAKYNFSEGPVEASTVPLKGTWAYS